MCVRLPRCLFTSTWSRRLVIAVHQTTCTQRQPGERDIPLFPVPAKARPGLEYRGAGWEGTHHLSYHSYVLLACAHQIVRRAVVRNRVTPNGGDTPYPGPRALRSPYPPVPRSCSMMDTVPCRMCDVIDTFTIRPILIVWCDRAVGRPYTNRPPAFPP